MLGRPANATVAGDVRGIPPAGVRRHGGGTLHGGHAPGDRTAGSSSTRAARAPRGRTRTGSSFRGCGTRPAGSDSPRLSRNTPHASGDRGRITTEKQNSMGAKQVLREMLVLVPRLQPPPTCGEEATHSVARQGPPRHSRRSRGCVGHSWRRRGLSKRSEFRSLQKECPARPRRITSTAGKRHRGTESWSVPDFLFACCDQLTAGLAPAGVRPCWAHTKKTGAEAPVFTFKPVEVTD